MRPDRSRASAAEQTYSRSSAPRWPTKRPLPQAVARQLDHAVARVDPVGGVVGLQVGQVGQHDAHLAAVAHGPRHLALAADRAGQTGDRVLVDGGLADPVHLVQRPLQISMGPQQRGLDLVRKIDRHRAVNGRVVVHLSDPLAFVNSRCTSTDAAWQAICASQLPGGVAWPW